MNRYFILLIPLVLIACTNTSLEPQYPVVNQSKLNNTQQVENTTIAQPSSTISIILPNYGKLTFYVMKVSEGQSIFVLGPDNKTMLIDASSEKESVNIVSFIKNLGFRNIDYAVATNSKETTIGGFPYVFAKLTVGTIIYSGYPSTNDAFIKHEGNWEIVPSDKYYDFGDVLFKVIVPYDEKGFTQIPEDSTLVLKFVYGDYTYLLMNECNAECQDGVENQLGYADVLFLANHGDCASNTLYLLNKVKPSYIINSYPEAICGEVQQKINYLNIPLKSTSSEGIIVITSDGTNIDIKNKP